ncbi:MAG TPA: DDE-type integrase/transposase/recombinase [Candidatus Nanoarchaeia archaeon]|nr:DDE-type integrase/transposase/recombinase [Candidatus Nanoarchaeia archaeon]
MVSEVCSPPKKNEQKLGTPTIKGRIHFDEKYTRVKDHWEYRLTAIDSKTKFVLAEIVVVERTKEACIAFLRQIKSWSYKQMLEQYKKERKKPVKKRKLIVFVSDKFENYKVAWKKLFYRITKLKFGVPIACKKFGLKHNNNSVERHNRELSRRFDALNVFQTHEGAEATSTFCKILHNYVNPHSMLQGKTPAEKAEFILPLGTNKLLDMIKLARKEEMTIS